MQRKDSDMRLSEHVKSTSTQDQSTLDTFQGFESGKMQQKSDQKNCQTLTYFVLDSLANLFRWLEGGSDLKTPEARYFLKSLGLQSRKDLNSFSLKTLTDYCFTIEGERLQSFSQRLMNWGTMQNGKLWTANISPPKYEKGFSLSQILEKKPIKGDLYKLTLLAHTKANIKQRIQLRNTVWTLDTSSSKFLVNDEKLTVIEKERLQGFPDEYTKGIPETQRHKCLGNAVTVPVVEYILEAMA